MCTANVAVSAENGHTPLPNDATSILECRVLRRKISEGSKRLHTVGTRAHRPLTPPASRCTVNHSRRYSRQPAAERVNKSATRRSARLSIQSVKQPPSQRAPHLSLLICGSIKISTDVWAAAATVDLRQQDENPAFKHAVPALTQIS
ncbi:hypothetical protein F2P81_004695 [Scophthalmus maximus]|uniref:Uncharacterized protein n=1 Tax=Scophthalmus maximus TaxID=52904 RepID=A0A6A4TFZ8_SCOMX|nr:hypothetical protein F2P81_004695 [Scophthalmus maximus]